MNHNWKDYPAPLVPIYFMELRHLKELFKKNIEAVSPQGLEMMISYYEEFEEFEKAAVVRDTISELKLRRGELDIINYKQ